MQPACERVAAIIEADPAPAEGRRAVGLPRRHRRTADAGRPGRATGPSARRPPAGTAGSGTSGIARELLLGGELHDEFVAGLDQDCRDIAGILQTVRLVRSASTTHARPDLRLRRDLVHPRLFERLLRRRSQDGARAVARRAQGVLLVEWGPLGPGVRWEQSRAQPACSWSPPQFDGTLVVTGFIATDTQGLQTTLGRNGSDFSASIFGALLDAARDRASGPTSTACCRADPRLVPEAHGDRRALLQRGDGARLLRRQGDPSRRRWRRRSQKRIPIWIRNTFAADKRRHADPRRGPRRTRWSRASRRSTDIALVNLEGAGMIGVPGTAHRLFGALREEGDLGDPDLAGQLGALDLLRRAGSRSRARRARRAPCLRSASCARARSRASRSTAAAASSPSSATAWPVRPASRRKVFAALGRAGVNVRAIAQGASERNISVVIDGREQRARAARRACELLPLAAHALDRPDRAGLGRQRRCSTRSRRRPRGCARDFKLDLRVRAHRRLEDACALAQGAIDLARWRDEYAAGGDAARSRALRRPRARRRTCRTR